MNVLWLMYYGECTTVNVVLYVLLYVRDMQNTVIQAIVFFREMYVVHEFFKHCYLIMNYL